MISLENLWETFFFYDNALFVKLSNELDLKNAVCLQTTYFENENGYYPIYEAGKAYNLDPNIQVHPVDYVEAKWR